jgi:integrase
MTTRASLSAPYRLVPIQLAGVREPEPPGARPPRLLDRARAALRARHYSRRTEEAYVAWIRRYIFFHGKRHPVDLGAPEVTSFLTSLAVDGHVAHRPRTRRSAPSCSSTGTCWRSTSPGWTVSYAPSAERLPVVLTHDEFRAVLQRLSGVPRLMASLLYGAGLRVLECCQLRVQDVDFGANQLVVRSGKGDKDRVTMLPAIVKTTLACHLETARAQHQDDVAVGAGWVELPTALLRKYPNAGREWAWQWVFPATRIYRDRLTGQRRRHHLHESVLHAP